MSSIEQYAKAIESIRLQPPTVHPQYCVVVRNRRSSCKRCIDACPASAMRLFDNGIEVDSNACLRCGVCASVCPTGAIELHDASDKDIFVACKQAMAANAGELVFSCSEALSRTCGKVDEKKVVGVVCLGRIDVSILAMASTVGAGKITLCCYDCAKCKMAKGLDVAADTVAEIKKLTEACAKDVVIRIKKGFPRTVQHSESESFGDDRRRFFGSVKNSAKTAAKVMAAGLVEESAAENASCNESADSSLIEAVRIDENGKLPLISSGRHGRLCSSVKAWRPAAGISVGSFCWGNIQIDVDRCSSCRMCATFCPTGALLKYDTANEIGVKFSQALCVGCKCCQDICVRNAISVSHDVEIDNVVSGSSRKIPMQPLAAPPNKSDSILKAMHNLIGCKYLYER